MNREEKCKEARHKAWDKAKDVHDRIRMLEKVISDYPEYMTTYSDIAVSYVGIGEIDNAIEAYQRLIDLKETFKLVWDNELGKAYLYTKDYDKSIEILEKSTVFDYQQGLFLAFAYLKNGSQNKFKDQFNKWISEDLEKSFERHYYMKYINSLFSEDEAKLIIDLWEKYYDKYSNMDKYKLYCELYKQHYLQTCMKDDLLDDDDFEIPPKLSRSKFEYLSSEYLYLDRKTMFGDSSDEDYDKYFELRDLLFGDIIYG